MKQLIFCLVGAMFLFVSCQSDLFESDEVFLSEYSKSENATKVTKDFKIGSYWGEIYTDLTTGEFLQEGGGSATHIGQFTMVNTASLFDFPGTFEGVFIAANGDEIWYGSLGYQCSSDDYGFLEPCPYEPVTLYYVIEGGTGRFEGATGEFEINGIFVPFGPYSLEKGSGWIGTGRIEY